MEIILLALLYTWVFWGVYVLVMGFYRAKLSGRLGRVASVLGLPFLVIGATMDVLANMTVATVLFLQLPKQLLVTKRLQQIKAEQKGTWRYKIADYICENLLDIFDPRGEHC